MELTSLLIFVSVVLIPLYFVVMLHPKFKSDCTQECNQGRNCTCVNNCPKNQSS